MSINHATSKKEFESAIYWIGKRSSILHYMKRKRSLENRSYDVSILESGNDVIYSYYYAVLQQNLTLATWSGISTRYEAYGWKPTEMTEEQCFRPSERWNMRPKWVREKEDYRLVSRT